MATLKPCDTRVSGLAPLFGPLQLRPHKVRESHERYAAKKKLKSRPNETPVVSPAKSETHAFQRD